MTGDRCHPRRKMMGRSADGGSADGGCGTEERPCPLSSVPAKIPVTPPEISGKFVSEDIDIYSQARKSLSQRSPFDVGEASGSTVPTTLPRELASFLLRQSDSKRRHKKSHLSADKKSSRVAEKSRASNFWVETEEYFRDLTVRDVDALYEASSFDALAARKFFFIPVSGNTPRANFDRYGEIINGGNENKELIKSENLNGVSEYEFIVENENVNSGIGNGLIKEEDKCFVENDIMEDDDSLGTEKSCSVSDSYGGLEWLLGCRNKICLTSERPSKKRKLLGNDAGLDKVLIARPSDGNSSLCQFCSSDETGNGLNRLIMCSSCQVTVHRKCYGVQGDIDSSWLCSWCKQKSASSASANPCVLCPKNGGALKPVYKSDQNGGPVEFAHLFCCLWMPEVYVVDLIRMEPIMNVEGIKETRRKLVCNICKVKWGACVQCSHGTCRTSFHPLCGREARHRIEVWGKYGCNDIELRAFCSKHSEVADGPYHIGDPSIAVESNSHTTKDHLEAFSTNKLLNSKVGCRTGYTIATHVGDPDTLSDKSGVSELQEIRLPCSGTNTTHSSDLDDANDVGSLESSNVDANAIDLVDFSLLWQKLVDHGKVNLKDVASEIGISPDSLSAALAYDNLVPDVRSRVVKWLKTHVHLNSLPKKFNIKIRPAVPFKTELATIDGLDVAPAPEAETTGPISVKSVPARRRTRSDVRILNDGKKLCPSKEGFNNGGIILDKVMEDGAVNVSERLSEVSVPDVVGEDLAQSTGFQHSSVMVLSKAQESQAEPLDSSIQQSGQSVEVDAPLQNYLANTKGVPSYPVVSDTREKEPANDSSFYIHPDIHNNLLQTQEFLRNPKNNFHAAWNGAISCFEILNKATVCCNDQNEPSRCNEMIPKKSSEDMHQLVKAKKMRVPELSPEDEVEGELVYFQHRLLGNAVHRKRFTDNLICNVVKSLQQEIDIARSCKWDAVLVKQYLCQLREAKKQGRKEKRHKEAQAILAAATAAAAASSRISSFRKDALDEAIHQEEKMKLGISTGRYGSSQLIPRSKETPQRVVIPKTSVETHTGFTHSVADFSKEHPRSCDICRRSETILNPILVCYGCKVAVHINCYRSVKESPGPWYCELCEEFSSSRSCESPTVNFWQKPRFVAECGLCGGTTGAFRKSSAGQWVHAFCAEWVFESTFRRGQTNLVEGMDTVINGVDLCYICHCKSGGCIKCNYGHCQATFHPWCARSSGFHMIVKPYGGKLQHKAYCEKHSLEQRAKAETRKHGIEELKSLKQIRVELERLRLLCERIIKREKLKRELVLCSHDILAVKRDHIARSVLFQSSLCFPEISFESATTSLKGQTDSFYTCEASQRSDNVTVDSTSSVKHQAKGPLDVNEKRTYDECSTSHHNPFGQKLLERPKFSGKQIPHRHPAASPGIFDDEGWRSKKRKHAETFEKELVMTSDQASVKNMLLPKGYVYVPADCLPNEKQISQDDASGEPLDPAAG